MEINLRNLGTVNKNCVTLSNKEKGKELVLYFSYETCISLELRGCGDFVSATRQNDWGTTTGKLLNECEPDKKKRITGDNFKVLLANSIKLFSK